jgi:O-antigen/teichoic acid export membrane protein
MMVSREFVAVVMGPKWEGVVAPLQLLCVVGALQSIGTMVGSVFNSQGRSDLQLKTGIVVSVGHVVGFAIGIRWGLLGLVKAYVVTSIGFFFFNQYFVRRLIRLPMGQFVLAMKVPAINSLLMVLVLAVFRYLDHRFWGLNVYASLSVSVCIGVAAYACLTHIFLDKAQVETLKNMVRRRNPQSAGADVPGEVEANRPGLQASPHVSPSVSGKQTRGE